MELRAILELVAVIVTIALGFAAVAGPAFKFGEWKGKRDAEAALKASVDDGKKLIAAQTGKIEQLTTDIRQLNAEVEQHARQIVVSSSEKIWGRYPPIKPSGFDATVAHSPTKIVTIGNLKGGVGKTTLTVNLAAHFPSCFGRPDTGDLPQSSVVAGAAARTLEGGH